MKILVSTKRVIDTDQKVRVRADGAAIYSEGLPFVINPFDAIALEEALRMRENRDPAIEIIIVGIGGEAYAKELRSALAMGADRALLVDCGDASLDPANASALLAAVVEREKPDLVLMGKQAVDDDYNQTAQMLAGRLDWPQATFASKIDFAEEGLRVERETDAGIETVWVPLPCVVTADLRLNEPRYASLPNIMKAKKKPIETVSCGDLGVTLEPRVEVIGLEAPSTVRNCVRVADVDELIARLRDEARVL